MLVLVLVAGVAATAGTGRRSWCLVYFGLWRLTFVVSSSFIMHPVDDLVLGLLSFFWFSVLGLVFEEPKS